MTAAAHPDLLTAMCRAQYEASRMPGSQRPPYDQTTPEWREAMTREMTAAIRAAEAQGWRIER